LLEVAALVAEAAESSTRSSPLLHDAIEDQKISPGVIAEQFCEDVAEIGLEATEDKSLSREARKAAQIATASHKSHLARLIKLADKISNVRSVTTSPPVDWSTQRRREYIEFCAAVVNELRGTSSVLEAEFDAAKEIALRTVTD
jgi:GTP diphosphokinase / guanosine-3',5'-bis(diphosphate) 3'-diphosphatase